MGEHPESNFTEEMEENGFPSFGDLTHKMNWLDAAEQEVVLHMDSPYSVQARDSIHQIREIVEELSECDIQKQFLESRPSYTFNNGFIDGETREEVNEIEKKEQQLTARMLAKCGTMEMFFYRMKEWSKKHSKTNGVDKTVNKKFPLKYNNNTFTYGKKSVPLKSGLSFASFCDYFYGNCTASGKLKLDDATKRMAVLIAGTTDTDVRQWISDFNRWAKSPRNFATQIGKGGKLLRVRDGFIERLK